MSEPRALDSKVELMAAAFCLADRFAGWGEMMAAINPLEEVSGRTLMSAGIEFQKSAEELRSLIEKMEKAL